MAYLISEFQNPTGNLMSTQARSAIVQAATRAGTIVIFDETLIDLWLEGPIDPYGFDGPQESLVRLGSMGKSFWGGLRLGWIRADAQIIQALAPRRASIDLGSPLLEQLAACQLLADEGASLTSRRTLLRDRRDFLVTRMRDRLPDWTVSSPPGGLSLWAELPAVLVFLRHFG